MYRPKPVQPVRLSKLEFLPAYDQLADLSNQAQTQGKKIELPWGMGDGREFMLAAVMAQDRTGVEWTLYEGTGPRAPVIWMYKTGDIPFLLNLLTSQCTGVSIEETIATESARSTTDKLGLSAPLLSGLGGTADAHLDGGALGLPASDVPVMTAKQSAATLEGDLATLSSAMCLQSVALHKLTGQLQLANKTEEINVFFEDGNPVHALSLEAQGNASIVELVTWDSGRFKFHHTVRTTERTVSKTLEELLREGNMLLEHKTYLASAALSHGSYLIRKNPSLAGDELEQALAQAPSLSAFSLSQAAVSLLRQFYNCVTGDQTLFEILRAKPLAKSDWIPILYSLVAGDLVVISDRPVHTTRREVVQQSAPVDSAAIESARKSLIRAESGLYSYPSLLWFLQNEFNRYEQGGPPFGVLLFDMMLRTQFGLEALQPDSLKALSESLSQVLRNIDLFGHFEIFSYGVLLPQTDADGTALVAQRLVTALQNAKIPLLSSGSVFLAVALGVGCVPHDAKEIGGLLAGLKEAKEQAKKGQSPIVLLRNMSA